MYLLRVLYSFFQFKKSQTAVDPLCPDRLTIKVIMLNEENLATPKQSKEKNLEFQFHRYQYKHFGAYLNITFLDSLYYITHIHQYVYIFFN